jgi:phospholipase C
MDAMRLSKGLSNVAVSASPQGPKETSGIVLLPEQTRQRDKCVNRLLPLTLAALCLTTPAPAQITSFQHIILVIQENRTPDNLFQGLCPITNPSACSTQPGPQQYNIQTRGWLDKTSRTGTTKPTAVQFGLAYDLSHLHSAFVAQCDPNATGACAMDWAASVKCNPKAGPCPASHASYGYVDNSTGAVQPYLDLVAAYGWANYMFQTNQGPSYPAHQFLYGATSAPSVDDDHKGIFVSSNSPQVGCAAPPTELVQLINPKGVEFTSVFPCFEHQVLSDLLDTQGVSWRYYGTTAGAWGWNDADANGIWIAPNSIQHICGSVVSQQCTGTEWSEHVVFTPSQVLSDISTNCSLAGVSWVTPDSFDSDHMSDIRNTGGPSWVASIVNAVGKSTCTNPDGSSYWNSTAILVTWDDWGGWYDHERPMIEADPEGGYQMGFRVPLLVVSAYTPAGFISNSREDFGSVIRFVERNFGIMEGALTFADSRGPGDLRRFFSLSEPPRRFQAIKAPLSAKYFLTRKPSRLPVDDDD